MEVVRLDEVKALSGTPWRRSASRRGEALRGRMAGEATETLSVLDLQEKAREGREPA
jgi:hypothetical protein